VQGTYETFVEAGRQHYGGAIADKWIVTAGLGGMGGAQPLAATMAGASMLAIECQQSRIDMRLATRYLDRQARDLDEALALMENACRTRRPVSVGLLGNAAEILPELVRRSADGGPSPHMVTDQTSAHDLVHGYLPAGWSVERWQAAQRDTDQHPALIDAARTSIRAHVEAMLAFHARGVPTFDYGNNIRAQAEKGGVSNAFEIPGFVPEYIRPLFCEGRGPFRWAALSGDPADIAATDALALQMFGNNQALTRWIRLAQERVAFQGLPARIFWLGYGERAQFGLAINDLVRRGVVTAPIVIGRDHLDAGSVASPNRETEHMRDGSDAIADWPILNALLNTSAGATWVSVHHGGGVGIGYSLHAGMVVVADGSREADEKLQRVLTCDPGLGVVRHADAGYAEAIDTARRAGITMPSLTGYGGSGR